jgi:hypothetical protein
MPPVTGGSLVGRLDGDPLVFGVDDGSVLAAADVDAGPAVVEAVPAAAAPGASSTAGRDGPPAQPATATSTAADTAAVNTGRDRRRGREWSMSKVLLQPFPIDSTTLSGPGGRKGCSARLGSVARSGANTQWW